ncbi:hypothetical protein CVT25_006915 [Psilocybe cyanescens]|uniref:Chitin synthase n=1 Tax=Psilocybe cyanescens TaxID=93625 RepID=A0A409X638_PSICY|nr:hypothetical protein CVT25_006915 [Psilocybe cyanescens]
MLRRRHTVLGPLQPGNVQPLLFAPTTPAALHHLPGPLIRRVPPALGAAPRLAPTPAVPCRAPALSFNPLLSPPFPAAVVYGDHRERQSYGPNTSTPHSSMATSCSITPCPKRCSQCVRTAPSTNSPTCVPNTFKDLGFMLQQVYYDPPRRTELFIVMTMYNEHEELFCHTMHGGIKNVAHLCKRDRTKT